MLIRSLLLGALLAAPQDSKPSFDGELKKLSDEHRAAMNEYYKPLREAKTDAEREKVKLDESKNPSRDFFEKFQDLSIRAKGTETGLRATVQAIRLAAQFDDPALKPLVVKMVDDAVVDYASSPSLAMLVSVVSYLPSLDAAKRNAVIDTIIATTPHAAVRNEARFTVARRLLDEGEKDAAKKADAYKLFELIVKESPDSPSGKRAAGAIFERDHLQVGMVAPDFEAKDQDGKAFNLSDYRGRVVMIDFWGFW